MLIYDVWGLVFCLVMAGCKGDEERSISNMSKATILETTFTEGSAVADEANLTESKVIPPHSPADSNVAAISSTGAAPITFHFKTSTVKVILTEGKMIVDTNTVDPAHRIFFEVRNATDEPRRFIVVETGFPPHQLPVKDGRVRYFTYFDEPHKLLFHHGGGWLQQSNRKFAPVWGGHRKEPGVEILPGQTVIYKEVSVYDAEFKSGTAFVIFCNEPGHYEQGEFAGVVIK